MWIAFRKPVEGSWIDEGIAKLGGGSGRYVHSEIVITPELSFAAHASNGCAFYKPTYDDGWEFGFVAADQTAVTQACQKYAGEGYDFIDVLHFIPWLRWIPTLPNHQFCSDVVDKICGDLKLPFWVPSPLRVSPSILADDYEKLGLVLKPFSQTF